MNKDILSLDKAHKRWYNLVKAHETLTIKTMFDNYLYYGDPNGSKAMKALELARLRGDLRVFLLFLIPGNIVKCKLNSS